MKNYMVRQFTCMSKADYNEVKRDYKTYVAELFKNGDIVVDEKKFNANEFHELYTTNLY